MTVEYIIKTVFAAFAIACIVQAVSSVFWEGMIFGKAGAWLEHNLKPMLWKPLVGCTICMTPWYGTVIALLCKLPAMSVICAMGINVIVVLWMRYDSSPASDLSFGEHADATDNQTKSTSAPNG